MSQVADILTDDGDIPLWIDIPPGYFALPIERIGTGLDEAESILTDVTEAGQQPLIHAVTGVLSVLLTDLAARGALYCGIGRHTSPTDGSIVTSSLVVSLLEFPGTRNPRLVLGDLVQAKADASERGQADLVDLDGRPVLFFERTRQLPTPQLPGQPEVTEDATSAVFQLEAFVPSADGSKLANIEFSTPFEEHGPQFRVMMAQLALSVSFEPPPEPSDFTEKIGQVLG
ncbi:MAG TPA: hypothetical protein VHC18_08130 [Amycolatopsis sp.]|nr:hypothetical protein [Amycolatopsis sp.]